VFDDATNDKESAPKTPDGWYGLVSELTRTFLLVRDAVGYVVPGSLAVMLVARPLFGPLVARGVPWAILVGGFLLLAYAAGQVGAVLAYAIPDVLAALRKDNAEPMPTKQTPEERRAAVEQRAIEALQYRHLYPDLFVETDRRATVGLMRRGLGTVLLALAVPAVLSGHARGAALSAALGLFMWWNARNGAADAALYNHYAVEAAKRLKSTSQRV
jgi:hypothetical protein